MPRRFVRLLLILSLLFLCACAKRPWPDHVLDVSPGRTLTIRIPPERWQNSPQAPVFLIEEMTEHLAHDLEAHDKKVDEAALQAAVDKRLAANEHYIFNPVSGAHLDIDFSPLAAGESAPSRSMVADSTRFAAQSLISEEGVTEVSQRVRRVRVKGADYAYSLDAAYRKHDVPTRFYGLIGFAGDAWFFFYYTDSGKDPEDYPEARCMLRSLRLLSAASR
ncbi:hypothetical protein [Trichloromonas sp.]|uniref:hypothetical protein n=1 Tax=Trichloromonas sp. TaxID=3069249 RepID=UPI002A4651EF|nr:hypothetical protein [Trichloromonas sp.]